MRTARSCAVSRERNRERIAGFRRRSSSIADVTVAERLVTSHGHLAHVPLGCQRLAEGRGLIEDRPPFCCVVPFCKEKHVAVRLVHDIRRFQHGGGCKFLADRWERVRRITRGQLPAVTNESGTINANCVSANRLVPASTLLRCINITTGFPGTDSSAETPETVVPTPFVSDADILRVREPAFAQRAAVATIAIRCMNFNAVRIFPVPHIFRERVPAMLNEGFGNL